MDLKNLNKDRKNKRAESLDLSTLVYGKVPPQAKDIEVAVLGSCMLEKSAFDYVSELLKPECFYVTAHQFVFEAMRNLSQKGAPIEILTVAEELRRMEKLEMCGGAYFLTTLTNSVVTASANEAYSRIIMQKFMLREMIRLSGQTINDAYQGSVDIFDLLERHERELTAVTAGHLQGNYTPIDTALARSLKRLEELRKLDHHITGVPTGFNLLDKATHGWQPGDLIILAARPAVGKTALALQLARHAANNLVKSVGVGFFSLEMSETQLMERIISASSDIWLDPIRNGRLDEDQMKHIYQTAVPAIIRSKIFIHDKSTMNIFELRSAARRMVRKENVGLIIIDYLQLMSGSGDRSQNREQEISQISRGLKQIAKELSLPIIALSQLSRAVENRTGEKKMPQLSDLRESGAIEQDADMVMFMYRPEYYDVVSDELGESTKGLTEIKIAKNRQGSLDTIKLRANLSIQKFYDWEEQESPAAAKPVGNNWRSVNLPYADDKDEPF